MSRFAILPARAIEDDRLSRTHIRALGALGTFTDKNGWAWPSVGTMADALGVSRQLVSRCLHDLKAWGYVEIRGRKGEDGGQTSNLYRVLFDRGEPVAPPATSEVAPPATPRGCTKEPLNDPSKVSACKAPRGGAACKKKSVEKGGVVCWTDADREAAAVLVSKKGVDAVTTAVSELERQGVEPLPARVSKLLTKGTSNAQYTGRSADDVLARALEINLRRAGLWQDERIIDGERLC